MTSVYDWEQEGVFAAAASSESERQSVRCPPLCVRAPRVACDGVDLVADPGEWAYTNPSEWAHTDPRNWATCSWEYSQDNGLKEPWHTLFPYGGSIPTHRVTPKQNGWYRVLVTHMNVDGATTARSLGFPVHG